MEVVLYEAVKDKVHTKIEAVLEYYKLAIVGCDSYEAGEGAMPGSDYEYETCLDVESTTQLFNLLCPNGTQEECLQAVAREFSGERADIRFQAYCFENEIETYCYSHFDD